MPLSTVDMSHKSRHTRVLTTAKTSSIVSCPRAYHFQKFHEIFFQNFSSNPANSQTNQVTSKQ